MRSLPLKLAPGSDLRLTLEELCREEGKHGFVLGVVGNLSRAAFQCPGRKEPTVLEGNLEIITLNGTLSPDGVHLHLSLSDGDCQVWGGHLEPGTLILKGADVLVGLIERDSSLIPPDITSDSQKNTRLEIFVIKSCPWSARAIRMLRSLEIPYSAYSVETEEDFTLLKGRSDMTTFPQVFIDSHLIGGYEALQELKSSGKLEALR